MRMRPQLAVTLGLVLLTLPSMGQAADYTYVTNNGAITITKYTGPGGDVTIPETINGLPVTSIGCAAFGLCYSLLSITIPTSITNIGTFAFSKCFNLSSVTMYDGLMDIGPGAFGFCASLRSVRIPNSVTNIGSSAFDSCSSLTNISIGNSVTSIGYDAFAWCTSLTDITIPNSVTTIERYAFAWCASLTSITIPASVASIGYKVFLCCTSLSAIVVDAFNSLYSSVEGVLFNKEQTTLIECPGGKAGNYTVPDTVILIEDGAFSHCTNLTSIVIPISVTFIRDYAFAACNRLGRVNFRGNAPSGSSSVFDRTTNAIIYYLPGTTGWFSTYGDPPRPTVLWQPQVQAGDATFGVQTNQFAFNIAWASGMNIAVDACTDLTSPTWLPLQTNTLTSDSLYFSDPDWTNSPRRFYRVRWPGTLAP